MALELKIPSVGESVTEVTISQWLKADGSYVEMDEPVAELESDKATVELNAEAAGELKILVEEGEDVEVGAVVAKIDTSAKAPEGKPAPELVKEADQTKEEVSKPVEGKPSKDMSGVASPSAKKILAEKGLSPTGLTGTGKDGRMEGYSYHRI